MGLKAAGFGLVGCMTRLFGGRQQALRDMREFVLLQYPAALGSAVHATPLVAALKAAVPGCRVTVLANGFAAEIFRGNPGVDRLVVTANPTGDLWGAMRDIRAALPRGVGYATLTTVFNERTSIGLAAVLAGAKSLVGYTLAPGLFRKVLVDDPALSLIAKNLKLVGALGHGDAGHFEPQVFFSAEDLAHARGLVGRFAEPERPLAVMVTQTSVTQRKGWRVERFGEVGRWLEGRGMNVVLVGSKGEAGAVAGVVAAIGGGAMSVAGETNLGELAALLSLCRVGVTLDTGTMHIGRAVGLGMVIVAPAWSPVVEWLPVGDERFVILKNLEMERAAEGYVIDEVTVGEVVGGVESLLGGALRCAD